MSKTSITVITVIIILMLLLAAFLVWYFVFGPGRRFNPDGQTAPIIVDYNNAAGGTQPPLAPIPAYVEPPVPLT